MNEKCPTCGRPLPKTPEQRREMARKYHQKNKEKINAKQRERMRRLREKRRD